MHTTRRHAFETAHYLVHAAAAELCLRVGEPSPTLDRLLREQCVTHAVFFSAGNPQGKALGAAENSRRHAALLRDLQALQLRWLPATGTAPPAAITPWRETSVLLLAPSAETVLALATRHDQAAWLYCQIEHPVRLQWRADAPENADKEFPAMPHSPLIAADTVAARLADPTLRLIDCRWQLGQPQWGPAQYAKEHLPGAHYADLDADLAAPVIAGVTGRHPLPSPARFAECCARWGITPDTDVVAYDDGNGAYAARLWWLLRWVGHSRVQVLDGGLNGWRAAGLPLSSERPAPQHGVFVAQPDFSRVVDAAAVQAALAAGRPVLDARAADRYAGQNETIDPIAGHVPGARNLPFLGNSDSQPRFLAPEALRARILGVVANAENAESICYCGSGVTACNNILAFVCAGLPEPKLYAGSWSEWITDPNRPVAQGPNP